MLLQMRKKVPIKKDSKAEQLKKRQEAEDAVHNKRLSKVNEQPG